jgi:uncharacterized protein YyaL (SSP411 family)
VSAAGLAGVMKDQFWDEAEGGFFYTGKAEATHRPHQGPQRQRDAVGNSVARSALLRLAALTGSAELRAPADRTLRVFHDQMAERPFTAAQMLIAADSTSVRREFAIIGDPSADDTPRSAGGTVAVRAVPGGGVEASRRGRGGHSAAAG